MKKLIFIGIIFSLLFWFAFNIKATTPPAPENEFVINKKIKQCAITKFNSKLSLGWEVYDICYDYSGCPKIINDFFKKELSFIRDVCNNGYLDIWYSDDSRRNTETHFQETIDYTKAETFYLGIGEYSRGDILIAVNTITGECNSAKDEHVRDLNIIPKISFKIKKEAEGKINQYLYDKEYHKIIYKSFCEQMGYKFIGTLGYRPHTKTIIFGVLLIWVIVIVGLIVFFRKKIQ